MKPYAFPVLALAVVLTGCGPSTHLEPAIDTAGTTTSMVNPESPAATSPACSPTEDPLQVIVSGAGVTPPELRPIDETGCAPLSNIAGEWDYYLGESDGHGGSTPQQFVSTVQLSRVSDHPEVLGAVETVAPEATHSFLGDYDFIMLWEYNTCMIIVATDDMQPVFGGLYMAIGDPDHLNFYGFGGVAASLIRVP